LSKIERMYRIRLPLDPRLPWDVEVFDRIAVKTNDVPPQKSEIARSRLDEPRIKPCRN
jgi:hypothetical protein